MRTIRFEDEPELLAEFNKEADKPCENAAHARLLKDTEALRSAVRDLQEEKGFGPDYRKACQLLKEAGELLSRNLWSSNQPPPPTVSPETAGDLHQVTLRYDSWVKGLEKFYEAVALLPEP